VPFDKNRKIIIFSGLSANKGSAGAGGGWQNFPITKKLPDSELSANAFSEPFLPLQDPETSIFQVVLEWITPSRP
jgi:hypothetical protein